MRIALAGLSLSGKTTLFDALSLHAVDSTRHPARADQPNVASVRIHDERVDWLTALHRSPKTTYAAVELVDLPGIVMGNAPGSAERPRILTHLRQCDAILYCLRAFASGAVPPPKGSIDPLRDYNDLRSEFLVSDLDTVMRRIEKVEATMAKSIPRKEKEHYEHERSLLQKCQEALESEQSLRPLLEKPEDAAIVKGFGFLTQKPPIIVLNIGEADIADAGAAASQPFRGINAPRFAICAKAESDILELPPEEQGPFLEDLGLRGLQSARLMHDVYKAVDTIVFLTSGETESRAWLLPRNSTALDAAASIHTDLARGFIRAEVFSFDDLRQAGSEKEVRAAGKFRIEGRDYVVQDGDILVIRFSP